MEPTIVRHDWDNEIPEFGTLHAYAKLLHSEAAADDGAARSATRKLPEPLKTLHFQYNDLPDITKNLIRDGKDKEKFELLLMLSRDIDYSVHHSAITAMRVYYGFEIDWGLMPEERLRAYEKAKLWWADNKDQLYWDYQQKMFVPIPD